MISYSCRQCGQPIISSRIDACGTYWHPEHFLCFLCKLPIGPVSYYDHAGKPCHLKCYEQKIAPRCAYCEKPLLHEYLKDNWGTKYCKQHKNEYPKCEFCDRLVPPGRQNKLKDKADKVRCLVCRSSSIEYINQAKYIFPSLIHWVNNQGLFYNNLKLHLELLTSEQLGIILKKRDKQTWGVILTTSYKDNMNNFIRNEVNGVSILCGLPSILFKGVTIHELGHAWLAVHKIVNLNEMENEGFCEVLAHRYYRQVNSSESNFNANRIEKNTNPIYGGGYRRISKIFNTIGFNQSIEFMRTSRTLPKI